MNVSTDDNSIDIDLAIETAEFYDISSQDAETMAQEILSKVKNNWEHIAKENGLSRESINRMRPAFDICYQDI